jgi:ferredoxin
MFDFERGQKGFIGIKPPNNSSKPIILFGVRPCDASSMTVLDKLFTWDYIDPYYVKRRDNATVISFGCTNPEMPLKNCFCTSVGGSPYAKDGADMLWTDIGDSYFVESFNDKGSNILKLGEKLFTNPTADQKKSLKDAQKKAENAITRNLDTTDISSALEKNFDNKYWEQFSKRCLGCGICTLLCPTCHCFDINDITSKGKGWRERTWDSCQYPYYTIHASGHNPRPVKKHRQRNRIYHKFLYMDKNLGVLGCVGCGRCISRCPVNIDIIEVAEGIKEVA